MPALLRPRADDPRRPLGGLRPLRLPGVRRGVLRPVQEPGARVLRAQIRPLRGRGRGEDGPGALPDFARGAPRASFDAVTIFQVVEHLDDPGAWLESAKSLLKPGGLLVV